MPNFPKNDGYRMSKGPIPRNYSNAPVMKDEKSNDEKSNKEKADRLNSMADKYSNDPSFRDAQTRYNQAATNDKTSGLTRYGKHGLKRLTPKQKAVKGGMPLEVAEGIGIPKYGKHGKGMPKTYKEAFKTRGEKYKGMGEAEYIKEAKAQNSKKYGTTKPSTEKSLSKEKKTELKTQQAAQAKKDATGKDKKRNDAARISNATVTEKKAENKVTVKGAKDIKKAKIKDAKQKGYENRKDKRAAVSDARKAGKAGVREAREKAKLAKSRERAMNKDSKMQANDKKAPLAKYKAHKKK